MISVRGLGIRFHHGRRRNLRLRELLFHGSKRLPQEGTFWPFRDSSRRPRLRIASRKESIDRLTSSRRRSARSNPAAAPRSSSGGS